MQKKVLICLEQKVLSFWNSLQNFANYPWLQLSLATIQNGLHRQIKIQRLRKSRDEVMSGLWAIAGL